MNEENICKLCLVEGEDKRTLWMSCFYELTEVVPEFESADPRGFNLRICKACRGALLGHLEAWRKERITHRGLNMDHDGGIIDDDPDRNIPIRINGTTKMMTINEFVEHQKNTDMPI